MLVISSLRALGALGSLALVYVVYYFYSPSIAAEFFVFNSFTIFASAVLKFGLDDYILKHFSSSLESSPLRLIFRASSLSLLLTLGMIPFILAYSNLSIQWYFFLIVPFTVINSLTSSYFQARKSFYVSLVGSSFIVPLVTMLLIIVQSPEDLGQLIAVYLVAILFQTVFLFSASLYYGVFRLASGDHKIFGTTQMVLYVNSVLGISGIHLVILVASIYMVTVDFSNFVILLRTCQASLMCLVIINFTFIPYFRACILDGRFTASHLLYRTTCYFGITCAFLLTLFFLLMFSNPFELVPLKLLSVKDSFFLLWPGFALSLCFGSIGYVYILSSKEILPTIVGFFVLVVQVLLVVGLNYYSFEAFLLLMSASYFMSKIFLYLIYVYNRSAWRGGRC